MKVVALSPQWSPQDTETIYIEYATDQLDSAARTIIALSHTVQRPDATEQVQLFGTLEL